MRIGFIGNMNNMPFILASALRDMGHDVIFLLNEDGDLCQPYNMFPEFKNTLPDWVIELGRWKFRKVLLPIFPDVLKAIKILNSCDVVVLNGLSVSLGAYINKPIIAFLTGSDLLVYATEDWINAERNNNTRASIVKRIRYFIFDRFRKRQSESIQKAIAVIFPKVQPESNDFLLLQRMNVLKKQLSIQYMPSRYFQYQPPRMDRTLKILYGARLNWKKPLPPGMVSLDCKGTDVFLKGISLLIKRHSEVEIEIVLIRKGAHIKETVKLIEELNIDGLVTWKDEMTQDEFYNECKLNDIIVDQMDSSVPGMVTVTAMTLGKIAMTKVPLGDEYRRRFSGAVIDVSSSEDVCRSLYEVYQREDLRRLLSSTAYQRALNYFTPEANAKFLIEVLTEYLY